MTLARTTIFLLIALVSGSLLAIFFWEYPQRPLRTEDLAACFDAPDTAGGKRCFEDTVRSLLNATTTAPLMAYIVAPSSPDILVRNCHPVAHVIGRQTFEKSASLETALEACGESCEHGCVHGAIGAAVEEELGTVYSEDIAHADVEQLTAVGSKYCSLNGVICHAVGHLLFIAEQKDLPALETCDTVTTKESRAQACYEGVFMESLGSRNSLIFRDTPETKASDSISYCTEMPARYRLACFLYSPALHYRNLNVLEEGPLETLEGVEKATQMCSGLDAHPRADCMMALASSMPGNARAKTFCDAVDSQDRGACILGVLRRYFLDQNFRSALNYCAQTKNDKLFCFNATFQKMANKEDGSMQELRDACGIAGDSALCLAHYREFVDVRLTLPEYQFGLFGKPE